MPSVELKLHDQRLCFEARANRRYSSVLQVHWLRLYNEGGVLPSLRPPLWPELDLHTPPIGSQRIQTD
jgi:hypothetical protein